MANTRFLPPSLITWMFHRVNDPSLSYCPKRFEQFLQRITQAFPIVIPGETALTAPISMCLTFDDAYADFYYDVFPLMETYRVPALLAVPVRYILNQTSLPKARRLAVPYPQGMQDDIYQTEAPLCTWKELREMAQSPYIRFASHGYHHRSLQEKTTDIHQEIRVSQHILSQQLSQPIRHFVYPYGKMTCAVQKEIQQHYDFSYRIGSCMTLWHKTPSLIYRINADPFWTQRCSFASAWGVSSLLRYWLNRWRRR